MLVKKANEGFELFRASVCEKTSEFLFHLNDKMKCGEGIVIVGYCDKKRKW